VISPAATIMVACINLGVLHRPEDNNPASLNSKRQRTPKTGG
jgi:hypothetical protein